MLGQQEEELEEEEEEEWVDEEEEEERGVEEGRAEAMSELWRDRKRLSMTLF